jgi:hypothetical protein
VMSDDPIHLDLMKLIQTERSSYHAAVPSPGAIWFRAQLISKRSRQQQALLPTRIIRAISALALIAALIALLYVGNVTGAIPASILWFAGSLFLPMYLTSVWAYWRISSD